MDNEILEKLSKIEKKLILTLELSGMLTHAVLLELGYDPSNDPASLERLSNTISRLNAKLPDEHKLSQLKRGSLKQGLNPVIVFSRNIPK